MGLSRDSIYKRAKTGGRQNTYRKKRKFRAARQASNTKIGEHRVHAVKCRGNTIKQRALKLDSGNFSWGSEGIARKTRILQVVYSPTNIGKNFYICSFLKQLCLDFNCEKSFPHKQNMSEPIL